MQRKYSLKFSSIACIAILALPVVYGHAADANASPPQAVFHSFSFGNSGENAGVEILDYRYGDNNLNFTHPPAWQLKGGHISQATNVSGLFPPGNSLYVKWLVKATGKVYEKRVNLKNKLPQDMDHQRVYFFIRAEQLYVYLIARKAPEKDAPDCPVAEYKHDRCVKLYP